MKPIESQEEKMEMEATEQSSIASLETGKITFLDIRDHLTGPVISVSIHIVLFSIIATFFVTNDRKQENVPEYIPEVIIIPSETMPDRTQIPVTPDIPDTNATNENNPSDRENCSSPQQPDIKFVPNDKPAGQGEHQIGDNFDIKPINVSEFGKGLPKNFLINGIPIPGPYKGRNPVNIPQILDTHGATETDRNLILGLKWLKENQNEDGSWGEDKSKQPALTGLATLAFLGRGIAIKDKNFGETLVKALKKLVEFGNNSGSNGVINGDGNAYCHPIVAYAISEAFCLMKIPPLEEVMNKMTVVMVRGQNKYGSFNYRYNNRPEQKTGEPRSDLSYAGWNFQALKAAFNAGSDVPDIENAISRSIDAIQKIHSGSDGSFCYGAARKEGIGTISMTSVGTLSLQLLNAGKSPGAVKGLKWIENSNGGKFMDCGWKDNSKSSWALYTWYYQTQAIFQGDGGKGDAWKKWNERFLKGALVKEQEKDGHWSSPYEKYGESKNGQGHGEGTGSVFKNSSLDLNIYSTSMCCLMLEVYYKYLPTFKIASAEGKKFDLIEEEEVKFE